jgi:hypothetical protein
VDRSVKDLSSTMQKFEDKEKQAGTPPPSINITAQLLISTYFSNDKKKI